MRPDSTSRDATILLDVRLACMRVREFIEGMNREAFLRDTKTQSAVIHQIIIIGEASRRLSARFQEHYPGTRWPDIAAMRNRLIHGYDDVDLDIVWESATVHVPTLMKEIEPLLPREEGQS